MRRIPRRRCRRKAHRWFFRSQWCLSVRHWWCRWPFSAPSESADGGQVRCRNRREWCPKRFLYVPVSGLSHWWCRLLLWRWRHVHLLVPSVPLSLRHGLPVRYKSLLVHTFPYPVFHRATSVSAPYSECRIWGLWWMLFSSCFRSCKGCCYAGFPTGKSNINIWKINHIILFKISISSFFNVNRTYTDIFCYLCPLFFKTCI